MLYVLDWRYFGQRFMMKVIDMITVTPFHLWHLLFIRPSIHGNVRWTLLRYSLFFRCEIFTAWDGWSIIGMGGITQLWNGVGEAWVILTEQIKERRMWLIRTVRDFMCVALSRLDLHRLQAVCRNDSAKAQRFAISLGFQCESLLSKYGEDGSDYWLYARIDNELRP
jgi:hypothetical protein